MKVLLNISEKLSKINKKLYIVGGYCRNKILGIEDTSDIDLCTDALPDEIKGVLNVVSEIGSKYGTLIIKEGNKKYEITSFRKDIGSVNYRKPAKVEFTSSLKEDSLRRDFTMNAIYYDVAKDIFINPVGGIEHLEKGIISFVGDIKERLEEDVLRLLRYVRFKNSLNLKAIDENYREILKSKVNLLKNISKERIKGEFDKILIGKGNIKSLKELRSIGFLKIFLPDIHALKLTPGGPRWHLEGDVWCHTLMSIEVLNNLNLEKLGYKKTHIIDLYWIILIHDVGKVYTISFDENNFVHYFKHEDKSVEIFKDIISKQFIFSNYSKKKINWILKNHLNVFKVLSMRKVKAYRFMLNHFFEDLMIIGEADHLGRIPTDYEIIKKLRKKYDNFKKKIKDIEFYNGEYVMQKYPELKGKQIGERIEELNNNLLVGL